jgi:hypothetical protein
MARQRRIAASNSFSPGEVKLLDEILVRMRISNGRPDPLARHEDYVSLCRKAQAMKRVIRREQQRRNLERANGSEPAPTE